MWFVLLCLTSMARQDDVTCLCSHQLNPSQQTSLTHINPKSKLKEQGDFLVQEHVTDCCTTKSSQQQIHVYDCC